MEKIKLKLKNWPFKKEEKAQLVWIGEPFKENNKWVIDTYFNNGYKTKRIIQDWANIQFLTIDKYYIDGDLNSGEFKAEGNDCEIKEIDLSNKELKYYESDWNIRGSRFKSKSRTLNIYVDNNLYVIPVIEVIRSILAPNTFMLNTILYTDIWDNYFTYEIIGKTLNINFTDEYRRVCLKDSYYNHLAWIISNKEVLSAINEIGYNMLVKEKIDINLKFKSLKIVAKVKKNRFGYTVLGIEKVKNKDIKVDEIVVSHPSFEKVENSNREKLRKYDSVNNDEERKIDNSFEGASKGAEGIVNKEMEHEYTKVPNRKVKRLGNRSRRNEVSENTKVYLNEDNGERTLGDEGGQVLAKGMEVTNIEDGEISSELKEFIEILELLKLEEGIKSVEFEIVKLPLGRKFSYLSDGVTRRKAIIGKLEYLDKKQIGIIEVERYNNALSTLVIKNISIIKWNTVYKLILEGLIKESGKWSNEVILNLNDGIEVYRLKHNNKIKSKYIEYISYRLQEIM